MSSLAPAARPRSLAARFPVYYGWVNLAVAVVVLVATLPGRSWGVGLVSVWLMDDFGLDNLRLSKINLWATLIGAAFSLPAGWLIDRFGARPVFAVVTACLGATVVAMARATDVDTLSVLITLTRGFGQSALSVVSVALVGKWFGRRMGTAMTVYMVGVLLGFLGARLGLLAAIKAYGWRAAWEGMGWVLLGGVLPLGVLLGRSTPEGSGVAPDPSPGEAPGTVGGLTLAEALATPAFWVFTVGVVLNSLTQSGLSLLGMPMFVAHGFEKEDFYYMLTMSSAGALAGALAAWGVLRLVSAKRAVAVGMVMLTSLVLFPLVRSRPELYAVGFVWGAAIGVLGVAGAAAWRAAYGRAHLGAINGAAAVCHVVSSAVGPLLMAQCERQLGSFGPFFYVAGVGLAVVAVATWVVPLPRGGGRAVSGLA